MTVLLGLLVILIMLVFNGMLAAYEMALVSVSRARLHILQGRRIKGASEAAFMKDHMEASLAVIQLGLTLVSAVAAATGGLSASDQIAPWLTAHWGLSATFADVVALLFVVIPLSGVTIVFAELVPKMAALNDRERMCLRFSPFMQGVFVAFAPIVRIFEMIVKHLVRVMFRKPVDGEANAHLHELQAAAALARTSRLIGAREERIVVAAAQLSTRRVREIMILREDMCTIPAESSLQDALIRAHMDMHTRFPVCVLEQGQSIISGYVNFKDIIAALRLNPSNPTIRGILRPITSVEWDMTIALALEKMIQENLHIMLVAQREKGVVGMITMEDIIEELVGDIEDEFDRVPAYIHPYGGGWIVGGGVTLGALAVATGWVPPPGIDAAMRLTAWCALHRNTPFEGGETFEAQGLLVTVRKLRRRKVGEVAVMLAVKA